jgi:hypothetical protein
MTGNSSPLKRSGQMTERSSRRNLMALRKLKYSKGSNCKKFGEVGVQMEGSDLTLPNSSTLMSGNKQLRINPFSPISKDHGIQMEFPNLLASYE